MTRDDRLAKQAAAVKDALQVQKARLARIQAAQRHEEKRALERRRFTVGTLVEQAGLFVWDDTTLAGLFACLAMLQGTPNPLGVLEGVLTEPYTGAAAYVACKGHNA